MNKKLVGLGVGVLVAGGIIASAGTVLAYRGDPGIVGPNYSADRHELMEKAFENKDYSAWKNLMQDRGRASQVVTQENFAKFAEAHELAEKGNIIEAQKIREELGLGNNRLGGRGQAMGGGMGRHYLHR